jgi:RNA polymerase sigma-70 factor, ECF subfamily
MTAVLELWFAEVRDDDLNGVHRPAAISPARDRGLEDAWAARIRGGDADAFADAYVTFAERLAVYARGYLRDSAVAEDVVQDVFTTLWNGRAELAVHGTLAAYLFGAVRFASLKWLRSSEVRDRYIAAASEIPDAPSMDGDDAESERERQRLAVLRAADDLPPRCREVFLLRWRDGLSYNEVASVLGISVKTVEMQLTIGVKRLRAALIDRG